MSLFSWVGNLFGHKKIKREIVINAEKLETRVAVIDDGRLEEFQVEYPDADRTVGSIYKGRIQNLENDLQAAFVDIGLKKNAFLHYWDMFPDDESRLDEDADDSPARISRRKRYTNEQIAKLFPPGSEIIVQISKGAISTKGPRVTASLSIPGRFLVMMPGSKLRGVSRKIGDAKERIRLKKILDRLPLPDGIGLIVRTNGQGASKRAFVHDLRSLLDVWENLQTAIKEKPAPSCVYEEPDIIERVVRDSLTEDIDRVTIDDEEAYERIRAIAARISRHSRNLITRYDGDLPIFDAKGVERQIEEAFHRKVNLKSGGYLVIDETEALIAIDVNTGRHKGAGSQEDSILEVNLEAVEEVARQLRLRNIGGLVVVDLIDMKSRKHQLAVYKAMKNALKRDRARTNVLQLSELGLMEMTRQRQDRSFLAQTYENCPYCCGHGVIRSARSLSVAIQRQVKSAIKRCENSGRPSAGILVLVAPTVLDRLRKEDEQLLIELQNSYKGKLSFRSEISRHPESFEICDIETNFIFYSTGENKGK